MSSAADRIARYIPRKAPGIAMKTVACQLAAALLFLQLPATVAAQQTDTMRCQYGIVSLDDTMPEVIKKCGPAAFQDRREQTRSFGQRHNRSYDTVTVDAWTYNFGPQEFMYEITFHNGRVARIDSLEHGY